MARWELDWWCPTCRRGYDSQDVPAVSGPNNHPACLCGRRLEDGGEEVVLQRYDMVGYHDTGWFEERQDGEIIKAEDFDRFLESEEVWIRSTELNTISPQFLHFVRKLPEGAERLTEGVACKNGLYYHRATQGLEDE